MCRTRALLLTVLVATLAACGGAPAARPTVVPPVTLPPDPGPAATPATAPPTAEVPPPPTAAAPTSKPTPKPTAKPIPVPPRPSGVTFGLSQREIKNGDDYEYTYTVTWKKPRTKGVEIRVYGVYDCLGAPEDPPYNSDGPCLVKGTSLPRGTLALIAKAKASDHVVSWKARESWAGCDTADQFLGPDKQVFYAIVLAAYGPSGHSVFAIAEPGEWWMGDPGDMPC